MNMRPRVVAVDVHVVGEDPHVEHVGSRVSEPCLDARRQERRRKEIGGASQTRLRFDVQMSRRAIDQ